MSAIAAARLQKKMSTHSTVVLGSKQGTWTAGGTIPPTGAYFENQYDVEPLRNIYDTPMVVKEIRFLALPNGALGNNGGIPFSPDVPHDIFEQLQVQFRLFGNYFSASPVQVDLLCTDYQTALEQELTNQNFCFYKDSFRRWVLPKDLVIPPGGSLDCRMISPAGLDGGHDILNALDIWVIYVGEISDDAVPDTVDVPYILQYVQPTASPLQMLNVPNLLAVDVPVVNLQNPLNESINIQRIIARLYSTSLAGLGAPQYVGRDILREVPDIIQCELTDSQNYQVVGVPSDLGVLVDAQRRGWTFKRQLGPLDYFKLRFLLNQTLATANYLNLGLLPAFCLVGYRTERMP